MECVSLNRRSGDVWGGCVHLALEMDRIQRLPIPEIKTPICMDRRFVKDVLGGPGQNRPTDTRIFNTSFVVIACLRL